MAAAYEAEVAESDLMSRFAADFFPKNLHFAVEFWAEHRANVRAFVCELLDSATLLKLVGSSAALMAQFNARYGWVPAELLPRLQFAYDNLLHALAARGDRKLLLSLFDEFFAVLERDMPNLVPNPGLDFLYQHRVAPRLTVLFERCTAPSARMVELERALLGPETAARDDVRRHFWPQLMLFFTRILDVYDQSLQGRSVADYKRLAAMRGGAPPDVDELAGAGADNKQAAFLKQFGEPAFWDKRYATIAPGEPTFDWYVPWQRLVAAWRVHVGELPADGGPTPHTLVAGCGNSAVPLDMYDDGLPFTWAFDRSATVVEHMTSHARQRGATTVAFKCANATATNYRDAGFDVVIEKAMLDATMHMQNALLNVHAILREMCRVLKVGGVLFSVSLGDRSHRRDVYDVDGLTVVDVVALSGSTLETRAKDGSKDGSEAEPIQRAQTYLWILRKEQPTKAEQLADLSNVKE